MLLLFFDVGFLGFLQDDCEEQGAQYLLGSRHGGDTIDANGAVSGQRLFSPMTIKGGKSTTD